MNINLIKTTVALACTAALAILFLLFYCQTFFDFGNLAKDRILLSPIFAFCTTPILFWVSAYLCRRFSPGASGSNMENLNLGLKNAENQKAFSFLGLKTVAICTISSLIATLGGGSLGREGPSTQMSAGIFFVTANRLKKNLPKISLENWIYAGAGIGLAVAFGAPIAGLTYVGEKVSKLKKLPQLKKILLAVPAIFIFALITEEATPLFVTGQINFHYDIKEILALALVALICGLLASLFKIIALYFYQKFVAIKSKKWHLVPLGTGLAVSIISACYGIHAVGDGVKTVNDALASTETFLSFGEVAARFFNTILTFASGSAGGIVAPSIAIGSGIGSVVSEIFTNLDPKIFILGGMAAFLGSTICLPITASLIVLEAASQSFFILPFLLFSAFVALFCANFLHLRA